MWWINLVWPTKPLYHSSQQDGRGDNKIGWEKEVFWVDQEKKQFNKEKQRKTKIFVFYFLLGDNVQPRPRK